MSKNYLNKKILRVDLSNKKIKEQTVPQDWFGKYIGGMGFGIKILFDEVNPKVDAFSPENKLIFSIGPLTGTMAPMFAQTCAVTKSPLTNGALNTYAGGFFGAELARTNYSTIVIEGRAEKPCYLSVEEDGAEIVDAGSLWGMKTIPAQEAIKKDLGKNVQVACIGPAGENLVRFSSIIAGRRAFGRGGSGSVMGSKNLKAVAVSGGERLPENEKLAEAIKEAREILKNALSQEWHLTALFSRYGTNAAMPSLNERGMLSTRNHQEGVFEGVNKISAEYFGKNLFVKNVACFACPVACGRFSVVKSGPYAGTQTEGPEYETIYAFGSNCGIDSAEAIAKADQLCDEYGMDTLSTGVTVSFAMECYERGIINKKDTGGLELKFGNHEAMVKLVEMIAEREGIGDLLAEGSRRASEKLDVGSEVFAMQVKGMEFAAWMPEAMKGIACTFATSNRGACHKRAIIGDEFSGRADPLAYEGKGKLTKEIQDKVNAIFTLVGCRFSEWTYPLDLYLKLLNAATGMNFSEKDFIMVGERIWNMERIFSGFTRKDDRLPERCYTHPIPSGPLAGTLVDREKFEKMLDEYYEARGWDKEGRPTEAKLRKLSILT
ncbi:MAG: aldehyde ferredoxin oxidoreductase family protein [Candidatus Hadarchaeum sp.]|uniref:aldehyde ferredoxin oxidoreductase family protein n=1 Tax=Candidatus Hadarchaeum sp. TaxID=2883567 RepID=UPI003D1136F3